ncbi:class I SAM-dependent DNA methyltransferase [Novosphingobium sp.]|uniref:class I SAM-dependent DNA methyltransferase n=1 Tax=Novosphingobium sp. TaxID=1874826 RepID=UPI003BAAED63
MNPVEIDEAVSTLALEPFDRAEFPFQFLRAFGNKETAIARLRAGNTNQSDVPGAVLQRGNIHIAACAPGEVDATLAALRASAKTASQKAKFILATDGIEFQAEDMSGGGTVACAYAQFADHFGFFLPLAGITTVEQIRESAFDIKATGRLNKLYVELLKDNPDWASADRRHDMNHFMARLIFCFFAEDTDIFVGEGLFSRTIEQMSARDSSDTHLVMAEVFRAMDTKLADRAAAGIKRYADVFPYVNGQLFSGSTECPRFSRIARSYLLHIGSLDWRRINPDIFGSMIQAVADDEERGALGMHYTSVPNILKVLNPLFLDDLRAKLEEAGDNARKLLNLRQRMAKIRVFDPACGSGNFLVIAYKQMRELEAEINRRRGEPDRRSDIPLTNFRGIELRDFPAEIARLALIIAEYQCDVTYRGQKEALAEFLPLDSQNWITCGNALRLDWLSICPPTGTGVKVQANDLFETPLDQAEIDFENEGGETYLCGNPPYSGFSSQEDEQKDDLKDLFQAITPYWKSFDYVMGWFYKAKMFIKGQNARAAFVSTNSICQGQLVHMFWPLILSDGARLFFAHSSFKWQNLASNNAGVTVVVVGISHNDGKEAKIYDSGVDGSVVERAVSNISPYIVAGPNLYIEAASKPLNGLPVMFWGNKPTDGGHLVLSPADKRIALTEFPQDQPFLRPYYGSDEFIKGIPRFCIWVDDQQARDAPFSSFLNKRIEQVRVFREASKAKETRPAALYPHRFRQVQGCPGQRTVIVPIHTSENRNFLPVGVLPEGCIISNAAYALYDAPVWCIGLIASSLHLVWIATVCGKLETRYRYSNTLGWNAFPVPTLTDQNKADLTRCAEDILLAREAHFPATIADLYDPEAMPEDLRAAHDRNDEVLERIYIGRRFRNDTERLEKLFELYTKMTAKGKAA